MIVPVFSSEFTACNILKITVGTNCPCGGDTGHGGRTFFKLEDVGATNIKVGLNGENPASVNSVEIVLGGDDECHTFMLALDYAISILRRQTGTLPPCEVVDLE